jgi:hypothetical protein
LFASFSCAQITSNQIHAKPGAWDTLKIVNPEPTPDDARNFGNALPIGNGRLGAKVFGTPAYETIPLNDTTLWSGSGPEHFESPAHHRASSRPGSGTMRNEQGIWNRDLAPHYSSNFTLNENPEKYYATAEPANIGETVQPEIDFVNDLSVNGAITAKTDYGLPICTAGCIEGRIGRFHREGFTSRKATDGSVRSGSPHWKTRSSSTQWSPSSTTSMRRTSSASRMIFVRAAVSTRRWMRCLTRS